MNKYEKYKDSGSEWIGEIPVHWKVKRIKRLSTVKRGASPRPIADPKYFDIEGEWSWVRIADVSASERYLKNTTQTLSELGASLSVKMLPDNLVLSIAGTVGKPIITKIKCCIHDGFVYFPDLKLDPEFLYYIFTTGLPYKGLGKLGTQLNLNTDTVGEIFLPIPSINEINHIANYLDRKTAQIDELIADKKRLLELYEEEKTAIINQAVTKGINPDVKMKDSGIEWLGEIPEHWEVKKLKYVLSEKLKYGANESALNENKNDPRYIRITDFGNDGKLRENTFKSLSYEIAKDYLLEEGDVLFARSGATVGKTFHFKNYEGIACFAGYLIKASPNKEILHSDFLYLYTKSSFYERWKESIFNQATIQNIGADKYSFLYIPVPPLEEQTAIVQHIETELNLINAKSEKTKKLIDLLTEYRTALISEVVTGKIKVME